MELKYKTDFPVPERRQFILLQTVDLGSVKYDLTRISLIQCPHYLKQCSLSGTARPHNTHNFTFPYRQIDPFQYLQRAETLGNSL